MSHYIPTLQKTRILAAMLLAFFCFNNSLSLFAGVDTFNVKNINSQLCKSKNTNEKVLNYRIKTVVIDAGHGGHDSGCLGEHSKEKDIALALSKQLAKKMQQAFPNLNIILTRKDDTFIPLYKRAEIANKNNADLFISIHCNATGGSRQAHGTETFVMGLHTAEQNLQVVKRENASVLLEENYQQHYPFDPNSDEGHIMASMVQHAFLDHSILFAEKIEQQFAIQEHRKSRGVKQAGFVVLKLTTMPSVLVETGFLTNQQEENYLVGFNGQQKIVNSIFNAFSAYKVIVEGDNFQNAKAVVNKVSESKVITTRTPPNKIADQQTYKYEQPPTRYSYQQNYPTQTSKMPSSNQSKAQPRMSLNSNSSIQFHIQLAASPNPMNTEEMRWKRINHQIEVFREGNLYKYQARNFKTFEIAEREKMKIQLAGFDGAFIVAYKNGKRMNLADAKRELGIK